MSKEYEMPDDAPKRVVHKNAAVNSNGQCLRCKSRFGGGPTCRECGVGRDRPVQKKRRRKIGGKRGRNSGKVSQHGKKG